MAATLTFAELLTEFYARGLDYLNDGGAGATRAKRFLNDSYHDICDGAPWPFLETTTTGIAPLSITDLRQVLAVADTTSHNVLRYLDRRTAFEWSGSDLTGVGAPVCWYFEPSGGVDAIKAWPSSPADTLQVRYIRVEPELSATTDVPLIPGRFHRLIVDGAVASAYEDSDNFMPARVLREKVDAGVQRMVQQLMFRNYDSVETVVRTRANEGFAV